MRPDSSRLGANVGFGYLGDDDDDDSAGGGGGDLFDALIPTWDATRNISESSTFTLAITANSAQTNGVVVVKVSDLSDGRGGSAITISTVTTDGWTQTGWSRSGGYWTNTLTKASVASGTTAPSFTFTSSVAGTCTISTASTAPQTTEAVGGGQGRTTVFGAAAAFDATPELVTASLDGQFKATIVCTGSAQTNGYVFMAFKGIFTNAAFTTIDLDGWSESGWTMLPPFGGVPSETPDGPDPEYHWYNILTRTNVPVGTTSPTWSVVHPVPTSSPDPYTIRTLQIGPPTLYPHTDQATGSGAALSSAFVP